MTGFCGHLPIPAFLQAGAAIEHILRSRDLVTAVRSVAESGKTTMLDHIVWQLPIFRSGRGCFLRQAQPNAF
jgi:hypothetical protein